MIILHPVTLDYQHHYCWLCDKEEIRNYEENKMNEEHKFQTINEWPNLLEPLFCTGDITTNVKGEKARVVAVDVHAPTILRLLVLITDEHSGYEMARSFTPNGTSVSGVMAYGNPNAWAYEEENLVPLDKD